LLDGRNRLDALETAGYHFSFKAVDRGGRLAWQAHKRDETVCLWVEVAYTSDPEGLVLALNVHRRHLNSEQKRDVIAKLIAADPSKSDRQIAETAKVSPTTVGTVRAKMEPTVQTGQLPKRVGKDGKERKQPAKNRRRDVDEKGSIQPKKGEPLDPPVSGLPATLEKRTSGLPAKAAKPEISSIQPKVVGGAQCATAESNIRNPILSAWKAATDDQKVDFCDGWLTTLVTYARYKSGNDVPPKYRIYESCEMIEVMLEDLKEQEPHLSDSFLEQYEEITRTRSATSGGKPAP